MKKLKIWINWLLLRRLKTLQTTKSPGSEGFTSETDELNSIQEELIPIILKLFQKSRRGGNSFNLILQGHNHPDIKTIQGLHKKRKLKANIPDEHRFKTPQQVFANKVQQCIKGAYTMIKWCFFLGLRGWFNIHKAVSMIHHTNKTKGKNHIII